MGKPKKYGNAVIFKGKVHVEEFDTPIGVQFYFGADWGYSNDPTSLVRCFIINRTLYIDYDAYGVGVELDELPALFDLVPDSRKWKIRGDNSRPETISHVAKKGFNVVSCAKWKGSVEDGVEFLRSFEKIMIHPRCKGAVKDFQNYKWKTDKNSGECLPIPADGSDHAVDACRYALEALITKKTSIYDVL